MIPYQTKLAYRAIVMTGGSAPASEEVPLTVTCKVTGPNTYRATLLNDEEYTMTTGEEYVLYIDRADDQYANSRRALRTSDIEIDAGPGDLEPDNLSVQTTRGGYYITIPSDKVYVYDESPESSQYELSITVSYT